MLPLRDAPLMVGALRSELPASLPAPPTGVCAPRWLPPAW
jgi:hypothetical protein